MREGLQHATAAASEAAEASAVQSAVAEAAEIAALTAQRQAAPFRQEMGVLPMRRAMGGTSAPQGTPWKPGAPMRCEP